MTTLGDVARWVVCPNIKHRNLNRTHLSEWVFVAVGDTNMKTTLKELMIRDLKKSGKVPRIIVTDDELKKPNKPKKKKRTTPDAYIGGCGSLPRKGWCGDSYKDWYVCGKTIRRERNVNSCGSVISGCGGFNEPRIGYSCGVEYVAESNYGGCGGSISRGC